MYYVSTKRKHYWRDRLTESTNLEEMKRWAQRESAARGERLIVRDGDFPGFQYGKTRAVYENGNAQDFYEDEV